MRLMRSTEAKRTVTYNLRESLVERIEQLARVRRTNRSHEADNLLAQALALPENQTDLAATAGDDTEVA